MNSTRAAGASARTASSTFTVPTTFTDQTPAASSHDSATDDCAARCTTARGAAAPTAAATAAPSSTSASAGTASSPSSAVRCVPTKPSAPVIRTPPLIRAARPEDGRDRLEEDRDVEPDRPVLEVVEVKPDEVVEAEVRAAGDLPEAGHSGQDVVPLAMPVLELRVVAERQRARPDETHLAAQDVEELRDLVERESSQDGAERGDARIAPQLEQ